MVRAASILLVAGLLSACTRFDAMMGDSGPPEPVGTLPPAASPAPIAAAPAETVSRQSLAAPSGIAQPTYAAAPAQTYEVAQASGASYQVAQASGTTYDATPGVGRPPSTFGAQAAGLQPAAPAYEPPQPAVVAPSAALPPPVQAPQAPASPPQQAATAPAAAPAASIAAADTIRFLPIIGAPSDKLQPLSARLGDTARAAGLSIVAMDDAAADLSLKGYFSAVDQDGVVSVIYVWDVIGQNGVRLHRIQDREASTSGGFTGSDPWTGVTPEMMSAIGQKSIGALLGWLDTQG
ncbi:hypothetical protein [Martelella limonii]|uniref:hypothetical protein n=1 Tax=Martelella limonii TaxID=1647649 RepID=UPI001580E3B1|nr:hypothetical protein [Martelella limonii]